MALGVNVDDGDVYVAVDVGSHLTSEMRPN
jgi:hypothetical protein